MAKIYSRCERCRRFRSLAPVLVYVPPGTMKTARLCADCEAIVGKIGRGLKREITKSDLNVQRQQDLGALIAETLDKDFIGINPSEEP